MKYEHPFSPYEQKRRGYYDLYMLNLHAALAGTVGNLDSLLVRSGIYYSGVVWPNKKLPHSYSVSIDEWSLPRKHRYFGAPVLPLSSERCSTLRPSLHKSHVLRKEFSQQVDDGSKSSNELYPGRITYTNRIVLTGVRVRSYCYRYIISDFPLKGAFSTAVDHIHELLRFGTRAFHKKHLRYYKLSVFRAHTKKCLYTLDLLLIFHRRETLSPLQCKFLTGREGLLTRYSKPLDALRDYSHTPQFTNIPEYDVYGDSVDTYRRDKILKNSPFLFFAVLVDKDPFGFCFLTYCHKYKLHGKIKHYVSLKRKIADYQKIAQNTKNYEV